MRLYEVHPPACRPISLALAKKQARVTQNVEDVLFETFLSTVVQKIEIESQRTIVARTFEVRMDLLPALGFDLPVAPLRSISSIVYLDDAGAEQTLAASEYTVERFGERARVRPAYGKTWPIGRIDLDAVRVRFIAGHAIAFTANDATDVFTAPGHGYLDGEGGFVYPIGGAIPAGLSENSPLFIRDRTADTFKLAASAGGAAIDITSAGAAPNLFGSIPPVLVSAMLLTIGHLSENREAVIVGSMPFELPQGVRDLVSPLRIWL